MWFFLIVVLAAIIFEYSNGFHDAANAIATVVSTKVLTPRQAIGMAAFFNLTGALFGAALATAKGDWSVIKWNSGLWPKVVVPMITSPIAGFILGGLVMFLLFVILHKLTPHFIHQFFGKAQILSAAWMAHSHGTNDAQK